MLDHHSASQWAPLYDVHDNAWIDEWAAVSGRRLPLPPLPPLRWPQEAVGERVSAQAAAATGLPQGIPVAAGTTDSFAELVRRRGAGDPATCCSPTARPCS